MQENKEKFKRNLFIGFIIFMCILAIFLTVYIQWFRQKSKKELEKEIELRERNMEVSEKLEKEFDSIFKNEFVIVNSSIDNIQKKDETKDIVYTKYQGVEEEENAYSIDCNIPYINLKSDLANKYNKEINDIFINKIREIGKEKTNERFTIEYISNLNNNILSLMIKATLKGNNAAQRIIIKTYCIDLKNNMEISFKDLVNNQKVEQTEVERLIKEKILAEQNKGNALKELGYEIFSRDVTNSIYKIENITEFYLDNNGNIYIIFAYGNNNDTGETDIIVI